MKIQIQHIPAEGMDVAYRRPFDVFPVLKQLVDEDQCRFPTPVETQMRLVLERDLITVEGVVQTTVQQACSRCLELFDQPIRRRFTLRYSREIPADVHAGDGEEVALTAEQIGLVYFKGEHIDLRDAVQEQVVLALPFKPLCRDECKGLCARCGADLNHGPCGCGAEVIENPFAVLRDRSWPKS